MATTDIFTPGGRGRGREGRGKRGGAVRDKVGGEEGVAEARGAELAIGELGQCTTTHPLKQLTSHSHTHTHTLHSLRKSLVHLSKSPTGTQGGARGLLQQFHSKLTQPLHPVILGDPHGHWTRPHHTQDMR